MGLFSKIVTALRGGAREAGEAIVDANANRIFEQEIVDAENHLAQAKQDLTKVMAEEMRVSREISRLQKDMTEHEGYAAQALNRGNESLALEIAQKLADLAAELATQEQALAGFRQHSSRLKEMIKATERSIADLRRQLMMVKTTESVQQATAAIADNYANSASRLTSAKDSLDRIRQRQQAREDQLKAGDMLKAELSGGDLQAKLREAGIGPQAHAAADILAKIKARQA